MILTLLRGTKNVTQSINYRLCVNMDIQWLKDLCISDEFIYTQKLLQHNNFFVPNLSQILCTTCV